MRDRRRNREETERERERERDEEILERRKEEVMDGDRGGGARVGETERGIGDRQKEE